MQPKCGGAKKTQLGKGFLKLLNYNFVVAFQPHCVSVMNVRAPVSKEWFLHSCRGDSWDYWKTQRTRDPSKMSLALQFCKLSSQHCKRFPLQESLCLCLSVFLSPNPTPYLPYSFLQVVASERPSWNHPTYNSWLNKCARINPDGDLEFGEDDISPQWLDMDYSVNGVGTPD